MTSCGNHQSITLNAPVPESIAIIMDGNGRWATEKGKDRSFGHQAGVETVRRITSECVRLGVKYLTLYTFSTENWNRPQPEIHALMGLVLTSLEDEIFMKNNVRFRVIGDLKRLPVEVQEKLRETEEHTRDNTAMTMVVALSYSSRWEITEAVKDIAKEWKDTGKPIEDINEDTVTRHLQTNFMPDPDLLIRTGGEYRISNYLLWQIAYTELYFTPVYWSDFSEEDLHKAIEACNIIAPEHLEVCVEDPFGVLNEIKNAGSIFLGRNVPEALGDYFAGPNHTLPTSGTARFSSPLGVDDFVKKSSFLYYTREALGEVAPRIADFAEREGLHAHAKSVTIRYEK